MKATAKNWIWFAALMGLILVGGIFLGKSRRADLGKSFNYSIDEYRRVDPALVKYRELEPIVPTLGKITALAVGEDGRIYIGGENGIERVGGETVPVAGSPTCLAVDEQGTLFVGMGDHVEMISMDGKIDRWEIPGEKALLTSIAADSRYVYAADAGSRRIWRYDRRNLHGKPLEIGKKERANGMRGFYVPSPFFDVAVSKADGSLWAVNPGYHALENYRPDGMPLSKWEASGMNIEGFSGCCNPSHFALLPDGAFVTAEKGLPRVKIHNVDGSLRCVVAVPDQFDDGVTGLDVAVDDEGKIYVLDPGRNQVRVFEEIK